MMYVYAESLVWSCLDLYLGDLPWRFVPQDVRQWQEQLAMKAIAEGTALHSHTSQQALLHERDAYIEFNRRCASECKNVSEVLIATGCSV